MFTVNKKDNIFFTFWERVQYLTCCFLHSKQIKQINPFWLYTRNLLLTVRFEHVNFFFLNFISAAGMSSSEVRCGNWCSVRRISSAAYFLSICRRVYRSFKKGVCEKITFLIICLILILQLLLSGKIPCLWKASLTLISNWIVNWQSLGLEPLISWVVNLGIKGNMD